MLLSSGWFGSCDRRQVDHPGDGARTEPHDIGSVIFRRTFRRRRRTGAFRQRDQYATTLGQIRRRRRGHLRPRRRVARIYRTTALPAWGHLRPRRRVAGIGWSRRYTRLRRPRKVGEPRDARPAGDGRPFPRRPRPDRMRRVRREIDGMAGLAGRLPATTTATTTATAGESWPVDRRCRARVGRTPDAQGGLRRLRITADRRNQSKKRSHSISFLRINPRLVPGGLKTGKHQYPVCWAPCCQGCPSSIRRWCRHRARASCWSGGSRQPAH